MSVSIEEVLNGAGYDLSNPEDCEWLLSQEDEFVTLLNKAQDLKDEFDDYLDDKEVAEDCGDYNFPSFTEWRELNKKEIK